MVKKNLKKMFNECEVIFSNYCIKKKQKKSTFNFPEMRVSGLELETSRTTVRCISLMTSEANALGRN